MKITFVTDTYSPQINGVATTLQRLVEGLRAIGHTVDIIRPQKLGCSDVGMDVPSFALPKYPEVRIGLPVRIKLLNRWSKDPPDVIYVATETPLGASAINAARTLKIPAASGFHTNYHQYMAHYQLPLLERATISYLRHLHNRSSSTFVPSYEVIDRLGEQGFKNLEFLPKGVDTKRFSPKKRDMILRSEWGAGPGSLVGLFVGRIAAEKNLPLILKTFAEIKKRIPDFVGVFVGDGPKLAELKEKYPDYIYAGQKRGEELAKYYASADLFVFPSLTETFGNVTLEGMASGLAVLAFDYAAAKQHIVDGETGYVAPFGDEDAFVEKALQMVRDPKRDEVRSEARSKARKVRWKKVIKRFEKNLVQLIEKNDSKHAVTTK